MNVMKELYLAGGCFWGIEHYLRQIRGIEATEVGYANGDPAAVLTPASPTYKEVCSDKTGFAEAVHVTYDPAVISLRFLAQLYFKAIDPTSINQQGEDHGTQYRTGIYYTEPADRATLQQVFEEEQHRCPHPIAVELLPLTNFFPAEDYHQDYLLKNPNGYCHLPPALFLYAKEANALKK